MCTEQAFTPESEQYTFIERDLRENVDRTRTPFVVLTGHRPMYVDSTQMCTGKHVGNSRAMYSLIGGHVGVRGAGPCMSTRHSAQVSYGMKTNTHKRKLYRGFVVGHRAVRVVRGKRGGEEVMQQAGTVRATTEPPLCLCVCRWWRPAGGGPAAGGAGGSDAEVSGGSGHVGTPPQLPANMPGKNIDHIIKFVMIIILWDVMIM